MRAASDNMTDKSPAIPLAEAAKALSDPIRLRMLALMNVGDACTCHVDCGDERPPGICVCELQELLRLGQSRISYHIRVLREAGFIREEACGKWTFYTCDCHTVGKALAALADAVGCRCGAGAEPEPQSR